MGKCSEIKKSLSDFLRDLLCKSDSVKASPHSKSQSSDNDKELVH